MRHVTASIFKQSRIPLCTIVICAVRRNHIALSPKFRRHRRRRIPYPRGLCQKSRRRILLQPLQVDQRGVRALRRKPVTVLHHQLLRQRQQPPIMRQTLANPKSTRMIFRMRLISTVACTQTNWSVGFDIFGAPVFVIRRIQELRRL